MKDAFVGSPLVECTAVPGQPVHTIVESVLLGHGLALVNVLMPDGIVRQLRISLAGAIDDPLLDNFRSH